MTQQFEDRLVFTSGGVSPVGIATARRFANAFRRLQKALGAE